MFRKKASETKRTHTLIYHHLGLGDFIIMSGGIKYLKKQRLLGNALCITKHQNLNSVVQLYSDVEDFAIISVKDMAEAEILLSKWNDKKLVVGFEGMKDWEHFDKDFYRIINVDFKERWDSFTVERDHSAEKQLIEQIHLPSKFAFVHDDFRRGLLINNGFINTKLPIIRPFITNSIFDWISILERATEIHCICSSFKLLTDSLPQIDAELFYHYTYVNDGKPREASITTSKKNWKII